MILGKLYGFIDPLDYHQNISKMNTKCKISLLILLVFSFSCFDNINITQSDIKKYPWLIPFISENKLIDFEGKHNTDLGTMDFSYKMNFKKADELFLSVDSIAKKELWNISGKSDLSREYSKTVSIFEKDGGFVKIEISIDTLNKRVKYKIK
jgi:hypothetical protein